MEAIDGPGAERLAVPCRSRASLVCGTPGVLPAAALFFALVFGIGRARARPDNGRARGDDKTTQGADPRGRGFVRGVPSGRQLRIYPGQRYLPARGRRARAAHRPAAARTPQTERRAGDAPAATATPPPSTAIVD